MTDMKSSRHTAKANRSSDHQKKSDHSGLIPVHGQTFIHISVSVQPSDDSSEVSVDDVSSVAAGVDSGVASGVGCT